MTRSTRCMVAITGIAILCAVAWVVPAMAAVDMFIKIEGVNGESRDKDHSGWIEVESFTWGPPEVPRNSRSAPPASPVMPGTLSITKPMDRASVALSEACASGKALGDVVIDLVSTDEGTSEIRYTVYTLSEVHLVSCGASGSEDRPTESVTLSYGKIDFGYTPGGRARGGTRPADPYAVGTQPDALVSSPVAPPAGSVVRAPGYAFPGGTITGLVLAPTERTVAHVPVRVGTISGVVIETQTDEAGRFEIDVPGNPGGSLTAETRDIAAGLATAAVLEIVTRVPPHLSAEPGRLAAAGDVVDLVGNYPSVVLEDPAVFRTTNSFGAAPGPGVSGSPTPAEILADTGRLSLPTAISVAPGGSPAITRYGVPSTIPPGDLVTVITDGDGAVHRFDTTTYATAGTIDSTRLRSGQATDFTFDFQFPAGSRREIGVRVVVTGAVTYERSGQLQRVAVDEDGSAQLVGTVNATDATPGGLPFSITPTVVP